MPAPLGRLWRWLPEGCRTTPVQHGRHRVLAWFRLPRQGRESVGHPVGDEGADVGEMVEVDVFGGAFLGGEDSKNTR
jgi:hypothetical protein